MPVGDGKRNRFVTEYRRNDGAYKYMLFKPLMGKRHIHVWSQYTMRKFAHCMKWFVDEVYPAARIIRVGLDNFCTLKPADVYDFLPPAKARQILKKLEFHYPPNHGNCLYMENIE